MINFCIRGAIRGQKSHSDDAKYGSEVHAQQVGPPVSRGLAEQTLDSSLWRHWCESFGQ